MVEVASIIARALRDSDIAGRYGGEEFGILLPSTDLEGATIVAQRLCERINQTRIPFENKTIPISASIGVAEYEPSQKNAEALIAQADEALYKAKELGRNRVVPWTSQLGSNN